MSESRTIVLAVLTIATSVMLLASAHRVNQWEAANGYPFGHMCNSIFTGWQNTCPAGMR